MRLNEEEIKTFKKLKKIKDREDLGDYFSDWIEDLSDDYTRGYMECWLQNIGESMSYGDAYFECDILEWIKKNEFYDNNYEIDMNKFNIGRRIKIVNTISNDEAEFPISYQNGDTGILCSKVINNMVQVILDKDDESRWISKSQINFIV